MRFKNYFQKKGAVGFLLLTSTLMLTSCGSYEYTSYRDGIYDEARSQKNTESQPRTTTTNQETSYYANYFSEKSSQIDNAIEDDAVFTDIDSYSSDEYDEYDEADTTATALGYETGQPAWGSNHDEVSINVINTGFAGGWYGQPYWGMGYNWYGSRWGGYYGSNWGIGWNNPYWYGGFYCPPFFRPYYAGNYGYYNRYPYRGRNRYFAYNRRARNSYAYSTRSRRAYNSNYNTRSRKSSAYSRSRQEYTNSRRVNASRRTRSSSSYSNRSSNNNTYSRSRSSSPSRSSSRYSSPTTRSRSSSSTRSRSYSPSSRSSSRSRSSGYSRGSSSRSSGASRSSGSSRSRSSGSRGGGRSRGRN
ncbi:hypothetical protein [Aquimarina sp. I32.4]|uniref:hypothetical protein n=1 Tax=Aquimarina sp. I32.4 TaxID=2053903 RepID=UPI000CDEFF58|nr:hypothetical protein [Aquimarina sp. I32.4]